MLILQRGGCSTHRGRSQGEIRYEGHTMGLDRTESIDVHPYIEVPKLENKFWFLAKIDF